MRGSGLKWDGIGWDDFSVGAVRDERQKSEREPGKDVDNAGRLGGRAG